MTPARILFVAAALSACAVAQERRGSSVTVIDHEGQRMADARGSAVVRLLPAREYSVYAAAHARDSVAASEVEVC